MSQRIKASQWRHYLETPIKLSGPSVSDGREKTIRSLKPVTVMHTAIIKVLSMFSRLRTD